MAELYGSHFEYASKSSRDYGLIIANVETSRMKNLYGEIEGITIFNRASTKRYLIADNITDSPISFDVEIVTDNQCPIEYYDRRKIEKWLFNRHDYRKLYLDFKDDCAEETFEIVGTETKRIYLNCRFVNPEKLEYNGGIVGYKATLEADSNMFWQDTTTLTFSSLSSTDTITVNVDSDYDDYIYPTVVITKNSSAGDITIINTTDDSTRLTKFTSIPANTIITMKGDLNYISGSYYEKFSNRNFVRMLDGENSFSVSGASEITIEFNNRRAF